jgi:hypothetical protein
VFSSKNSLSNAESIRAWSQLADFRSAIRREALQLLSTNPDAAKRILSACDEVRNSAAAEGIKIEDTGASHAIKL